jgi:mono/diheme cytochrome c family protein
MARPISNTIRIAAAGFLAGCGACVLVAAIGGMVIVATGAFDVTARDQHGPFAAWATHATMIHAEQRRASTVRMPAHFTTQQILAGARAYDADCSFCHGAPGVARSDWVAGMTPTPPYLVDAARHWSGPELFSIVGDGVKMTGMPAWRVTRSDHDILNLVAFLEALPDLSPQDYTRMKARPAAKAQNGGSPSGN